MSEEDKKQLELLRERASQAYNILNDIGFKELAANLLLNAGFACGVAYRLEHELRKIHDHIDGLLI